MVGAAVDLQLIPRSVRDKLDRVLIKLHLKEWEQLSLAERTQLFEAACGSPAEVESYRRQLQEMVQRRTGRLPETLAEKRSA
jgi:hypothetical protein